MIIGIEKLTGDLISECMPLIEMNHEESGQFEELNIDWPMYLSCEENFRAFTLRDKGNVVGILFFLTCKYPHNINWVMAQQITFYVTPEYRPYSINLMKYAERHFTGWVDLIIQSARVGSDFCKVLERKGYVATDITYTKRLS